MRPHLVIFIFLSSTAFAQYHEKTRFDRSVHDGKEVRSTDINNLEKKWSFTDDATQYIAYKNKRGNDCYLENTKQNQGVLRKKRQTKILYASTVLTKLEAWRLAGGRIVDFCNGRSFILLQANKPIPGETLDPFLNEIPVDENDISSRRVSDVILTPLISRTRREIQLEQREIMNKRFERFRQRRQTNFRGKFRGQTQSQYLNIGNGDQKEGKAEAESTQQSSRAVVSGTRGMGQAQSMSSGGTGCEDCPGYPGIEIPDKLRVPSADGDRQGAGVIYGTVRPGTGLVPGGIPYPSRVPPGTQTTYPGGVVPGRVGTYPGVLPGVRPETYPGGVQPGVTRPGTVTPGVDEMYPGGVRPGAVTPGVDGTYPGVRPGVVTPGTDGTYPGGVRPGVVTPGVSGTYPGGVRPGVVTPGVDRTYPGVRPGVVTPGTDGTYPGVVRPGVVTPGVDGTYPGVRPGVETPGTDGTYPGGVRPGVVTPDVDGTYPGGVRPGTVIPGVDGTYPGGVRPGTVIPGADGMYPGGVRPGTVIPGADGTYPGVRPGTVIPGADGMYPGGVRPGTVIPGADGTYPGVRPGTVIPGADGMYPGGVRPGTVIPGADGTYPGVRPGTVIPGANGMYPGGVRPGTVIPGADGMYPGGVRPGTVIPGADGTYPGVRPGTVIPGADGMYPGGVRPGTVIPGADGTYPGVRPGTVIPGADGTYPGGVRPGVMTPISDRTHPPGTLITGGPVTYPGGVQPGGVMPGTTTTGIKAGVGTYPGSIQPGVQPGQITYSAGDVITSVTTGPTIIGIGTHPGSIMPGIGRPGETYPGGTLSIGTGRTYPGTGIHPGSIQPGTVSGTYPGGVVPGRISGQGVYPGDAQKTGAPYPGGVVTGTVPGALVTYPVGSGGRIPDMVTSTGSITGPDTQVISYPGTRPTDGQATLGTIIQPGRISGETGGTQVTYPGTITYPGGGQPQVVYPSGTQQVIPPGGVVYPGQQIYPSNGRQVATYPGQSYPGTTVGIPGVPGGTVIPGGIQYPISTTGGQVTLGGTGVSGQYPDGTGGQIAGAPYPGIGRPGATTGVEGTQYTQIGAGAPTGVADDNAESQASSSVQQEGSDTQASASAQGRYGQGTAQSQVTGTYSGSGTFSAQAGTSDANKSAQTEVSGGKEGATSNAQGVGGYGKSQALVQLNSDSGATSTGAQSSGWNHGTNSQVQASSKGGMADAQANGEGSTSSQAQIGFQPYIKGEDEKLKMEESSMFRGSGTASAQSGTHRGQSQSQLQGSFQYGITYTGAAQAGSGSGAASSRKPFNFNITQTEPFRPFKPQDPLRKLANVGDIQSVSVGPGTNYENRQDHEQGLESSSTSRQTIVIANKNRDAEDHEKKVLATEKPQTDDAMYDEYDDDYTDEYYDTTATTTTTLTTTTTNPMSNGARALTHQRGKVKTAQRQNHQAQVTQVIKDDQYDIHVTQDSNLPRTGDVLQPGQSLMGYTIPPGFRGRVMSISGTETIAQGDGKSQSQTVSLVPKNSTSTKPLATETRSLQTNHERQIDRHTLSNKSQAGSSSSQAATSNKRMRPISATSVAMKPSYYSVTNSVAGKMNGNNAQKQYEHRYYTKSSTCGYFTFSCNVVYGSNGRTKICKPKAPTYPDGTPMRC